MIWTRENMRVHKLIALQAARDARADRVLREAHAAAAIGDQERYARAMAEYDALQRPEAAE